MSDLIRVLRVRYLICSGCSGCIGGQGSISELLRVHRGSGFDI